MSLNYNKIENEIYKNSLWYTLKTYGVKAFLSHYGRTLSHKWSVAVPLVRMGLKLIWRALTHDLSKFSIQESKYFCRAVDTTKFPYGSPEDLASRESVKLAIEAHIHNPRNRHHPEAHKLTVGSGIYGMSIVDLIEMVSDWRAAGKRNLNGNIAESIEKNAIKFEYDDEMKRLLKLISEEIK